MAPQSGTATSASEESVGDDVHQEQGGERQPIFIDTEVAMDRDAKEVVVSASK